ncbi:primase C terminal 2 family protein [Lysobacter antibioticus]|uniref:PriCT-2 domain-containing protein n=1 Tax=Lysobacter antibioticus TaxID=84531 RepID=UPI00071F7BB0|nr:PriCT-2 domain-containing protein [Lysobacter antibioticus]ALN62287.1 primase C terminal 2 family protein [Lysobacter antibioticus]
MLAENLAQLDPAEFDEYSEWLNIMMASHHATNGEGLDEFTEWSTGAPGHADAGEVIAEKWSGFNVDDGGVTVQYLYRQLHDRGLTVHDRHEPEDDFEAVEEEPFAPRKKRRKRDWRVLSIEDLLNMPPPRWIVEGALQEESAAVLFGPPCDRRGRDGSRAMPGRTYRGTAARSPRRAQNDPGDRWSARARRPSRGHHAGPRLNEKGAT